MIKYWKINNNDEINYIQSEEQPTPDAIELSRLPNYGENWENGAWVVDETIRADYEKSAELSRLTILERHKLAIKTAKLNLIDDFEAEGIINKSAAGKLKNRSNF